MKPKLSKILSKPWAAYTMAACCAVILYYVLGNLSAVGAAITTVYKFISPILVGIVVAYLFNPVQDLIEDKLLKRMKKEKGRHGMAVFLTILAIVILISLLLVSLIPSIIKSVTKLIDNWDGYVLKAEELLGNVESFAVKKNINFDFDGIRKYMDNASDTIAKLIKENYQSILSAAGNVGSSVSNFAIGVLFGFCFLFSEKTLVGFISKIRAAVIPGQKLARHNELFTRCHKIFIRYLVCTLSDALIIGLCVLIFTVIMGMPYAPLIAVICAITNIIPTIGPWIGTGIGIFFLVLDKPINALWFFIFCCIIQSVDGMLIKPKLFKNGLGIPATWSIILLVLGGKIAGMIGIILSIPFGAIVEIIYEETILPKLEKRTEKINPETKQSENQQIETET